MNIYVDGAMNKYTNGKAWASVVDSNGEDLVYRYQQLFPDLVLISRHLPVGNRLLAEVSFNDVSSQQNNGAELISLVMGLRIALTTGEYFNIYCDSELIVSYWSKGHINPKTLSKMDPNKYKYICECVQNRKLFETIGGNIIKISGDNNLADLGFHK